MKDRFDKAKDVAQIIALVAVPILVAAFGWNIQSMASTSQIKRDYVQMAITILSTDKSSARMRKWATEVLDKSSPVPFSPQQSEVLVAGEASNWLPKIIPPLPADLASQCPAIPRLKSDSFDDLALAYVDLVTQYAKCAVRHNAVVQAWPK